VEIEKSETQIQKEIKDYLEACNFLVLRMNAGVVKKGRRYIHLAESGTPDLLAIGIVNIWFEVKRPGEKPSDDQIEMIHKLEKRGERVHVVCSVDDVRDIIRASIRGLE